MKLLIVSDICLPQLTGVSRTYEFLIPELEALGHHVKFVTYNDFPRRISLPFYKEIQLVIFPYRRFKKICREFSPDVVHLATEGTLGWAARRYCRIENIPFNTFCHINLPAYAVVYLKKFLPIPARHIESAAIWLMRCFHRDAICTMVATQSFEDLLRSWQFKVSVKRVTFGVSTDIFNPRRGRGELEDLQRPIALYVGRVANDKNLDEFLNIKWVGSKVIIGEGPALCELKEKFPSAQFLGKKTGKELAAYYCSADIFVFPSKNDTFGLVLIEALACGLPVAAYEHAVGPKDIITHNFLGALSENLADAANCALNVPGTPEDRHAYVKNNFTWKIFAKQFVEASSFPLSKA